MPARTKKTKKTSLKLKSSRSTAKTVKKPAAVRKTKSSQEKAFEYTLQKLQEMVGARAAQLWEKKGKPEGRDEEIWCRAEKDILSKLIKK